MNINQKTGKAYWRDRVREVGLEGVIREEMARLGFWPPSEEVAQQAAASLAALRVRYEELSELRDQLSRIERELGDAENIVALLAEGAVLCFAMYIGTRQRRYLRFGLVIVKWTVLAGLAFFAVLILERVAVTL